MDYTIDNETFETLAREIADLKRERKAVILAHYYQRPEVQDVADFVGDSLQLSRQAAGTDAEVVVFCGVHFMAESAAILSPEKTVLLPEAEAGCPMAEMVDAESLRLRKRSLPGSKVVCYVNSSADVKAECDVCCTSSNAAKVVESLGTSPVLFVPDKNLGLYVSEKLGKPMDLWPGFCLTHDRLASSDITEARRAHPRAKVIVHPECREEVWRLADYVGSTAGLIRYAQTTEAEEFIVGTESGILHQLQSTCPDKKFYLASDKLVCRNMKATTLVKVRDALRNLSPRITVAEETRLKAKAALDRMLELG
ncbi:quinolinate synthetase complex, A subunit [Acididesulfobacillus acetoxydans]|uniref:Quinolinate synthase n=1 Tax=Acididesulfobacillus acetoxydans TaxID=1561005 RepID=A0A8S0X3A6_9FIRM|nr:quinolinate synthase NadA [Acididesulfobacillus acetoxydans]CAA7599920.1 quinolinate synthetase complex, A subunit [Acididesulfobacillus acetoxydans]CEJ06866.1 Quinolinate synthase A [Acididesulfobacillus acetoxydans]